MSTNTSSVINVPPWARTYVEQYANAAYGLWQGSTLAAYTGTIVAPQNQDEVDGIGGLATRGKYGDQIITKAIAYLTGVIEGDYLDGAEADFQTVLSTIDTKATAAFASVDSRIGRKAYYTGDPDATYLAKTLSAGFPASYISRMDTELYAENYAKERSIQHHALGFGVEMGKHSAIDAEALRRAGLYTREYLQGVYPIYHKLYTEQMEINVARLEVFGNCLRALTGSQQTSTQESPDGNKLMNAVGGAVVGGVIGYYAGSSLAASAIGGPWGLVIGAVVGGVLGWLS